MSVGQQIDIRQLCKTDYRDALALQRRLHGQRVAGDTGDLVLITEHDAVITLGRNADAGNVLAPRDLLRKRGIAILRVERGGDVTMHCPGQLVVYPIVDLRAAGIGVRDYVWALEEAAISLLAIFGVSAGRSTSSGVWVSDTKIASVGVYISHWVTMHGLAINIAPDLADFELIRSCGLPDVRMTSVAEITGEAPSIGSAAQEAGNIFAGLLGIRRVPVL